MLFIKDKLTIYWKKENEVKWGLNLQQLDGLIRDWQSLSKKKYLVDILDFVGCKAYVTTS